MRLIPLFIPTAFLASLAALGCGDQGPPLGTPLSIRGQVLSADPTPVAVAGAIVALQYDTGFLEVIPQTLAKTVTDQAGNYQFTKFTSDCRLWIETSADGYETASSFTSEGGQYSDPPINCTNDPQVINPQVINLSLQPLGSLKVITNTSGPGLDPDGYYFHPGGSGQEYPVGLNDEQIVSKLPGQYSLELTGVAGNCAVAGDNPLTVTVAARDTTVSTFQVSCAP